MTPHQMNTFQLAENLGMTVTRMQREMTLSEFYGWIAFYGERQEQEKRKPGRKSPRPSKNGDIVMRGFDL